MKSIVYYKDIFRILQKVQSVVDRKEIRPILSQILVESAGGQIDVYATNLEVSVKQSCSGETIEHGRVVVDAKKFYEIIREMPEEKILLERKENYWVTISVNDIVFNIAGLAPDEFPHIDFCNEENFQPINRNVLRDIIEKTLYASSVDESRHNLNGVFFEKTSKQGEEILRCVATDGHRLSMIEKPEKELNKEGKLSIDELKKGIIFPRKGLLELKKMLDEDVNLEEIHLLCKENMGLFRREGSVLAIRTIDEEFPNFSQALPDDVKNVITINRTEFFLGLRRISVIAEERSKAVHLDIGKDTMSIYASNPILGEGREVIPIDHQGEDLRLGFNAGYIIDVLNAIKDERVVLKIRDKESPVVIQPTDSSEYTCIIMPMEMND